MCQKVPGNNGGDETNRQAQNSRDQQRQEERDRLVRLEAAVEQARLTAAAEAERLRQVLIRKQREIERARQRKADSHRAQEARLRPPGNDDDGSAGCV